MKIFKIICLSICLPYNILLCNANAASVRGYVQKDSKPVSGATVIFYVNQDEKATELARKTTDKDGRFLFSGPFLKPGMPFALTGLYKGVPYHSSTLEIGSQKEIIIEVFDTTSVSKKLRIDTHHLFLTIEETQLNVVQLLQMHNEDDMTFTGNMENGERLVTQFQLNGNLFGLENYSGYFYQTNETTFYDNRPLPPGETQLSFSFSLDPKNMNGGYRHEVIYPTNRLEAYIQPTSLKISNKWEDLGIVDLHGSTYRRILRKNLPPGESVLIKLSLPLGLRNLHKWIALSASLIISVMALWGANRNRLSQNHDPIDSRVELLTNKKRELLIKIAHLDKQWEQERNNPIYTEQRNKIIVDAVTVTKQIEAL